MSSWLIAAKLIPIPHEEQELGLAEVEVPKILRDGVDVDSATFLHFVFSDLSFTAELKLKNTSETMDIPRFNLIVEQGNEVTFKPGNHVELDLSFSIEGDLGNIEGEDFRCSILVASDTEDNVVDRYSDVLLTDSESQSPVWLDLVKHKGHKGNRFGTVVINSTREDLEGILDVHAHASFNCSRNCLLKALDIVYSVRFYREDHSGPFPEGFIGFTHDDFREDSSQFQCSKNDPDYPCNVYCSAVGSSPSTIGISRLDRNGDTTPVNDISVSGSYWSFSQFSVDDVSVSGAHDFRCTARTQTKEITMDLTLTIVEYARIDQHLSSVTKFENGVSEYLQCMLMYVI